MKFEGLKRLEICAKRTAVTAAKLEKTAKKKKKDKKNRESHKTVIFLFIYLFIFIFCLFVFSRAELTAYGGSWARGLTGISAAGLGHSLGRCGIQVASATYTAVHGNAGSLTH